MSGHELTLYEKPAPHNFFRYTYKIELTQIDAVRRKSISYQLPEKRPLNWPLVTGNFLSRPNRNERRARGPCGTEDGPAKCASPNLEKYPETRTRHTIKNQPKENFYLIMKKITLFFVF